MSFKDLKRDYIIDSAKKLFLNKSISEITIKDISSVSNIGEATVYRYFATKENLAIAVSMSIQQEVLKFPQDKESKTGLKQIEDFFNLFRNIFVEHRDYFKFISEFETLYLHKGTCEEERHFNSQTRNATRFPERDDQALGRKFAELREGVEGCPVLWNDCRRLRKRRRAL